jgi:hypothetical protein
MSVATYIRLTIIERERIRAGKIAVHSDLSGRRESHSLHFGTYLFVPGNYQVNLVDEDDNGRVLLSFLYLLSLSPAI